MAVIAFTHAAGAPGSSSTALGVSLTWPRDVRLIEADPLGASMVLAGYRRGAYAHRFGVLDLAIAARTGGLAELLTRRSERSGAGLANAHARVIAGLPGPEQAHNLALLWADLLQVLDELDPAMDAIVDLGRLGAEHYPARVLAEADLSVVATRTDLPSVARTRAALGPVRAGLDAAGIGAGHLRLVTVGDGAPYSAGEVAAALELPLLGAVAWDPQRAAAFSHGVRPGQGGWVKPLLWAARLAGRSDQYASRTFTGSGYVRSVQDLAAAAIETVAPDRGPGRAAPADAGPAKTDMEDPGLAGAGSVEEVERGQSIRP